MLVIKRHHPIIEDLGCGDRGLAIVEFGKGDFGIGVDKGLLIALGIAPPEPASVKTEENDYVFERVVKDPLLQPHGELTQSRSGRVSRRSAPRNRPCAIDRPALRDKVRRLSAGGASHERTRLCLKFPVSRENTGNFIDSELSSASTRAKKALKSVPYEPIPYAPEQGIFCGLAGN